ncbi:Rieske (2Fe-2S) protein [Mucilaginibacter sp. PAMB04274]|uniref:Rieske (2Fe-2S) protein n=1 Tax=Mucilaginibacter sp. PAMB04274 TaxID=3138568 RepID=UPI0031F667AA
MAWYKVADGLDLSESVIKKVHAGGKTICLIVHEKNVYALSAWCPHAGADLSGGWCQDEKLVCPYHRYSYDLQTGRGAPGQNDYVTVYPVRNEPDGVYIEVKSWLEGVKRIFK